jgi:hypothetical protein
MTIFSIEVMLQISPVLYICSELKCDLPTVCSTINCIASGNATKTNKSLPITEIFHVRFEIFTAVTMRNAVFWDVAPCGLQSAATCSRWFLARGFFYPEDGSHTFFRNVGSRKIYTAPHPKRRHSLGIFYDWVICGKQKYIKI